MEEKLRTSKALPRITFEEVRGQQMLLVPKIRQLMRENRVLREEEEEGFFNNYSRSTLGLGANARLFVQFEGKEPYTKELTVDKIIYTHLSSLNEGEESRPNCPPSLLWRKVLDRLNDDVFGNALQEAIRISPERDKGKVYAGIQPEG